MKIRTQCIKIEPLPIAAPEAECMDRDVPVAATSRKLATDEMSEMDSALSVRRDLFWSMMQRMGINTLLVSIPTIARALGYSPATLYGYISRGTFFLPHRVVNGSPMVAVDDLVDWLASRRHDENGDETSRGSALSGYVRERASGQRARGHDDRAVQTRQSDMLKKAMRLAAKASTSGADR